VGVRGGMKGLLVARGESIDFGLGYEEAMESKFNEWI
jgi:hypothetical protein